MLSGAVFGKNAETSWDHKEYDFDLPCLKGMIEDILTKISLDKIDFIPYDIHYL